MQPFQEEIIKEKLGKIRGFAQEIMVETNPFCRNENGDIREISQLTNKQANYIKILVEQISGILKNH
jgi:hypothetical protein